MPSPVGACLPAALPSNKCSTRTRSSKLSQIVFTAFLLTLTGREAAAQSRGTSRQFSSQGPPAPSAPRAKTVIPKDELLFLEPHNFARVIESLATSQGQIILTTLSFTHQERFNFDQLNYSKNFAYHLNKVGRLQNLLVLSYDEETCLYMLRAGLLCWVDRTAPQPSDLKGQYAESVPHWFEKYWWVLTLLEMEYTVLFMDNDAAVFRDPFQHYDNTYDIQGLSDWNYMAELPTPQETLVEPCNVYKMVPDQTKAGGQLLMFTGWAAVPGANHTNPCQSTGLWFAIPSDASKRFLRHLLVWLLDVRLSQWDQAAWNEVIMAHLFGAGDREPLRHRLLPEDEYNNYGTYVMRLKERLPVREVALHMGAIHGVDKAKKLQQLHFWKPTAWKVSAGQPIINQMVQVLREEERSHARRSGRSHRANIDEIQDWRQRAGLDSVYRRGPLQLRRPDPLSNLRDLGLVALGAAFATALWSCWSWINSATVRRKPSGPLGTLHESTSLSRRWFSWLTPQRQARAWGPAVQSSSHWDRRGAWQGGGKGGHGNSPARSPTPSKLLIQGPLMSTTPESPPLRSLAS
ncbi:hypothetical protein WJX74_001525 [Apatococcus lobatus]|uniref:Nucleotide-diphospho-sugar transferase domain-containing protein n=1 Tax=Apatococcus lobatus TaxID=904363 RepID=A0AAW1QYK0_9CHLO